jgi:hypothetical protein
MQESSRDSCVKNSNVRFDDVVSSASLKEFAKGRPDMSLARKLILMMDDSLPRWIAVGQLLLISKILYNGLAH